MDEEKLPLVLDSHTLPYSYINFNLPDKPAKYKGVPRLYFQTGYAPKLFHQILIQSGFVKTIDLSRASVIVGSNKHETCHKFLLPQQKNDHYLRTFKIGSKIGLHAVMTIYATRVGKMPAFYPMTFLIPQEREKFIRETKANKGTWIVKPTGGSCGRDIFLTRDPQQILDSKEDQIIAQEYIPNPMLINSYKFDLRFYVAVTSIDPLRVYIYQNGLVRIATTPYVDSVDDLNELSAHLTNFSLNKDNPNYVVTDDLSKDGEGNKWSHKPFWPFLEEQGFDAEEIKSNIYDAIATLFVAGRHALLKQTNHRLSVELYGADVLIDEKGGIHVLEVNVSPALGVSSALDYDIKSHLIRDFFNLALFPDGSVIQTAIELEMEDGVDSRFKEYVAICEFEAAEKRTGNFVRIFPTIEYENKHGKIYDETKLDAVLRLWISMDIDSKASFIKKRRRSFDKCISNEDPYTKMCSI
jgi:tubulin polyglutamylase TTLL4